MFPWKYFFVMKWERSQEIKREFGLHKGRFPYSWVLLRFENNNLKLTASRAPPSLTRTHLYEENNLPYNLIIIILG